MSECENCFDNKCLDGDDNDDEVDDNVEWMLIMFSVYQVILYQHNQVNK